MKQCKHCGFQNDDNARFCSNCSSPLSETPPPYHDFSQNKSKSFIEHINEYVGNEHPTDLNWKMLFTSVLKKHTKEEAENIFICGTKRTTPSLEEVSREWPHPWLYSRVLLMFFFAFMLLYICCDWFRNTNALPGLIFIGALTIPAATLVLFLEVNAYRNISFYDVIQIFFIGGCASILASIFLSAIFFWGELDFIGALTVGIVEEVGKGIIIYYFIKKLSKRSILTGLLIGASVGAGFAAFESAGYALNILIEYGWEDMINNIYLRAFLSPGSHAVWAAITGGAIMIATTNAQEITLNATLNNRFFRLFAIPIILHFLWDSPLAGIGFSILLVPILLSILAWIVVLILINMGLAQIPPAYIPKIGD